MKKIVPMKPDHFMLVAALGADRGGLTSSLADLYEKIFVAMVNAAEGAPIDDWREPAAAWLVANGFAAAAKLIESIDQNALALRAELLAMPDKLLAMKIESCMEAAFKLANVRAEVGFDHERNCKSAADMLRMRITALVTPAPQAPIVHAPQWACYECGSSEGFTTVNYPMAGDADVQCDQCGSKRTGEANEVLRELAGKVDELRAEKERGAMSLAEATALPAIAQWVTELQGWIGTERVPSNLDLRTWLGRLVFRAQEGVFRSEFCCGAAPYTRLQDQLDATNDDHQQTLSSLAAAEAAYRAQSETLREAKEETARLNRLLVQRDETIEVQERLLVARDQVLHSIPPCDSHGPNCCQWALEWIQNAKSAIEWKEANSHAFYSNQEELRSLKAEHAGKNYSAYLGMQEELKKIAAIVGREGDWHELAEEVAEMKRRIELTVVIDGINDIGARMHDEQARVCEAANAFGLAESHRGYAKAIRELISREKTELFRVVNTDNFGGDYPDEKFVDDGPMEKRFAEQICKAFNSHMHDNSPRFHKVVPADYVLQPGFEP